MTKNYSLSLQAILCSIFLSLFFSSITGQIIVNETLDSYTITSIPEINEVPQAVPCDGNYFINVELAGFEVGSEVMINYVDHFGQNGDPISFTTTSDTYSFTIDFDLYNYVSGDLVPAVYAIDVDGEEQTIVGSSAVFAVSDPNYLLTTYYFDDVDIDPNINDEYLIADYPTLMTSGEGECIPELGDDDDPDEYVSSACLYYQNNENEFTRITTIELEDPLLQPNGLTLNYAPETDISVVSVSLQANEDGTEFYFEEFTENAQIEFDLIPAALDHISTAGNRLRFVEVFRISSCSTVNEDAESKLELFPCVNSDFFQSHPMNAMLQPSVTEIDFCFNIETDESDIIGIPLFENSDEGEDGNFNLRFTFDNRKNTNTTRNSGHKELGFIVLPIDLRPLIPGLDLNSDMEDINDWLDDHLSLELEPLQTDPLATCDELNSVFEPIDMPDGFARVYEESIGFLEEGTCESPDNVDALRRVVLDFSVLNSNDFDFGSDAPLTNWFSEGEEDEVLNTFMENTRFSVLFKGFNFNHNFFEDNDTGASSLIITEPLFRHNCEPENDCSYTCENARMVLFENGDILHFYTVSKNMCERLETGNAPMEVHEFLINDPLTCPSFSGTDNPLIEELPVIQEENLQYRNPVVTINPVAGPPGIVDIDQSLNVEFKYGLLDQSGAIMSELIETPWDFRSNHWETLFDCPNHQNRARISFPLALAHRCTININHHFHTGDDCDSPMTMENIVSFGWNDTGIDLPVCGDENYTLIDVYVIDEFGEHQPLFESGEMATCSIDKLVYVDFELKDLGLPESEVTCNYIEVDANWSYNNPDDPNRLSCPDLCGEDECIFNGGTQTDFLRMTVYTQCNEQEFLCPQVPLDVDDPANDEVYIHKLGCAEQEIFYVCGPPCVFEMHCFDGEYHSVVCDGNNNEVPFIDFHFNTYVWDGDQNPFKMLRGTFGYDLTEEMIGEIDYDNDTFLDTGETWDGEYDSDDELDFDYSLDEHLIYNQELGYPADMISTASKLTLDDFNITDLSLHSFLPGDRINIEAKGIYGAYNTNDFDCNDLPGNAKLAYVIQTEMPDYIYTLPCLPDYSSLDETSSIFTDYNISLTFSRSGFEDQTFYATDFIQQECTPMEDELGMPLNTMIFVFEDFYNAPGCSDQLLLDDWIVKFNGFVFMNPETSSQTTYSNQLIKGSFAILNHDYEDVGYCPVKYSCDNNTTYGNYYELWSDFDFFVNEPNGAFTACTRPYSLKMLFKNNDGESINSAFGQEYRPIFSVNDFEITSTNTPEFLDLDHHYWGNPKNGAGMYYTGTGSTVATKNFYSREFDSDFTDHSLTVRPDFMGSPEIDIDGIASRFFYGSAEVKTQQFDELDLTTENQQIGESIFEFIPPVNTSNYEGQIMQCDALSVEVDLEYYLDDDIHQYVNAIGVCSLNDYEVQFDDVYTDLKTSRVGFTSGSIGENEIVSQIGIMRSADIKYYDFTVGGNNETATMSFFVTIPIEDDIEFLSATLVKVVDYDDEGTSNFEQEWDDLIFEEEDGFKTFYFHQDYYYCSGSPDNVSLECNQEINRMFFPVEGPYDVKWHIDFEYELKECVDGNEGLQIQPDIPVEFDYYFGQACAYYDESDILHFSKCQTALSVLPNCPDGGDCPDSVPDCVLDLPQVDNLDPDEELLVLDEESYSLIYYHSLLPDVSYSEQKYHTGIDGIMGSMLATWGNQVLAADIQEINNDCEQGLCILIDNSSSIEGIVNIMDAYIDGITLQYPMDWPEPVILSLTDDTETILNTNFDFSNDGIIETANITFDVGDPEETVFLSSDQTLNLCIVFPFSAENLVTCGNIDVSIQASDICENVLEADGGTAIIEIGDNPGEIQAELSIDTSDPCAPYICAQFESNQTCEGALLESVTLTGPFFEMVPLIDCSGCIDGYDPSINDEMTYEMTDDIWITQTSPYELCWDIIINNEIIGTLDEIEFGLNASINSSCGSDSEIVAEPVIWTVPNEGIDITPTVTYEDCSPTLYITYENTGDFEILFGSTTIFDYFFDLPDVVITECPTCEVLLSLTDFGNLGIGTSGDGIIIQPGESIEICINIPIDDPESYEGTTQTFDNIEVDAEGLCGPFLIDLNVLEVEIDLFGAFDFDLAFNEQSATCIEGMLVNNGSVDIQPYDEVNFDYQWTGYPLGYLPSSSFDSNPTDLMPGDYTLTITDVITECSLDYEVSIGSEVCCEIEELSNETIDCITSYEFNVISDCSDPLVNVIINGPSGVVAPTITFTDGLLEIEFDSSEEGSYDITIDVQCTPGDICDSWMTEFIISEPCLNGQPGMDCFAIWDGYSMTAGDMEGNAILNRQSNFDVFGSAHESNGALNYYNVEHANDNSVLGIGGFGNIVGSPVGSRNEFIKDAVYHDGYNYAVGYGQYSQGSSNYDYFMISKIDPVTGDYLISKVYHIRSKSNDRATGITLYQRSNGSYELAVVGYTNANGSKNGMDVFIARFNTGLTLLELETYDVNGKDDFAYDILDTGYDQLVVAGKSDDFAAALIVNYNLDIEDQMIFRQRNSQFNAVTARLGRLYFVGNMIGPSLVKKAIVCRTNFNLPDPGDNISYSTYDNLSSSEDIDVFNDIIEYDSRLFITGESGLTNRKGLLTEISPIDLGEVWSKETMDSDIRLKGLSETGEIGAIGLVAVGDRVASDGENQIMIVRSDLEGNSCCANSITIRVEAELDQATSGFKNKPHVPSSYFLQYGPEPYQPINLCVSNARDYEGERLPFGSDLTERELAIIPNPNDGSFELRILSERSYIHQVELTDASGKLISVKKYDPAFETQKDYFKFSNLESGLYLMKVKLMDGQILNARIVVN